MLNRRTVNRLYRGFESRPLRSSQNTDDSQCQETPETLEQQGDEVPGIGPSFVTPKHSSVTDGDQAHPADGPRSDKPDDKLSDKPLTQDQALAFVAEAWPRLPHAIRGAILAMVQALEERGEQ